MATVYRIIHPQQKKKIKFFVVRALALFINFEAKKFFVIYDRTINSLAYRINSGKIDKLLVVSA